MTVPSNHVAFITDLSACGNFASKFIAGSNPGFLGRIGGSDTDVAIEYFDLLRTLGADEALARISPKFDLVRRFNGYYDKSGDPRKIARFCELLTSSYGKTRDQFIVGGSLLTAFMPDSINPAFHVDVANKRSPYDLFFTEIGARQHPANFCPYSFVEQILHGDSNLLSVFSNTHVG